MNLIALLALTIGSVGLPEATWEKLADPPRDVAGRESPPGADGAWVYVPAWKGFLLYGGNSPTHSNEGWFFDPDKGAWTLLWPHDALAHDEKGWRVLLPRDLVWSLDRPGPGRSHGIVHDGRRETVYLFGGFPAADYSKHFGPDPRLSRELFLGASKLGTWSFDPATGKFQHITSGGPAGLTRGVYDPVNDLVVAMPLRADFTEASKTKPGVTWIFDPKREKWNVRSHANGPRAFPHSGFVYDTRVKKCVYYSGFGETWIYDAGTDTWEERKPAQTPPPRRHAALCFDEARGVTILQAGVHHDRSGVEAFSLHKSHNAAHYADTWSYDAVKNEWTELKPAQSPPRTVSSRCLAAYDPDRKAAVVYDIAVGVWAYRSGNPPRVKAALAPGIARLPAKHRAPPVDDAVRPWRDRLKNLKDNTWLDLGIPVPRQGCMNVSFDPVNHCLVMLGGCGGALFGTPDDFGYNNQVWLLDMQVGRYALRRTHQVWGPQDQDFRLTRMAPGCTRGNCFDAMRNVLWTAGGNGWSGAGTTHIRTYDVAADKFSRSGPPAPWGDGECGMFVHDLKHDVLVYVDGRRHQKTYLYDPKKRTWTDGGPCPLSTDETLAMFSARVYDYEIGVIAIIPGWKDWKLGDPRPTSKKLTDLAVRTFAYDVVKKQWRDLAPTNQEKVPYGGMLGVAYDSRNRRVVVFKSDHGDVKPLDPKVPYGTLSVLDLATNTWEAAAPGPNERLNLASMTYDPRLNVVLCRFYHRGLWAYRCQGGCPPDAFPLK